MIRSQTMRATGTEPEILPEHPPPSPPPDLRARLLPIIRLIARQEAAAWTARDETHRG